MYRIAIIGHGYMARRHIACLERSPQASVAMVINRGRIIRNDLPDGAARPAATEDELLSQLAHDDRVDGVIVCSPDHTHPDYQSRLLPSEKVILCEKPLARTEQEFEQIQRAVDGSRVLVGMNCRFRTRVRCLKALVTNESAGNVRSIRAAYYSNVDAILNGSTKPWWMTYPPATLPFLHGGAIHMIDALRFVAGEVTEVSCTSIMTERTRPLGGTEFFVTMKLASGAVAEMAISGTSAAPNRFEILLEAERCSVDGTTIYRTDPASGQTASSALPPDDPHDLDRQLAHMIDVIATDAAPLNSVAEAFRNFQVIHACERSAVSGQWVAVDGGRA
jgi:predicted dehydrogenase